MQEQNNKVALVTGASSGIGEDVATALLNDGYTVYAAARRVERMAGLARLGAKTIAMDITKEEDVQNVVETIRAAHGGVDVLVNNAGFGLAGPVEHTSIDDARYQFEVNLFGLARVTQAFLPHMREQKHGYIFNISSMGGKVYTPLSAWYHGTKHALEGWSDSLRMELEPFGINVVVIEPGAIDTEFGDVMLNPMMERSRGTAYSDMAQSIADAMDDVYERVGASPPSVISDLIIKALHASRPKTRYVAGKFAKPMMFVRKWLGDRNYDRVLRSQFLS